MKYTDILDAVRSGARFYVNLEKRTLNINGKKVELDDEDFAHYLAGNDQNLTLATIESLYYSYKYSVPSERSESHRRSYFKAVPYNKLTDEQMMYGERREVARFMLEFYVLMAIRSGSLKWNDCWGSWFWQSQKDKDLVILRQWVEPKNED